MPLGSGDSGSGAIEEGTFTYSCDSHCITMISLEGSISLGPVIAGTTYYCSLVISNALGDINDNRNIIPVLGKTVLALYYVIPI